LILSYTVLTIKTGPSPVLKQPGSIPINRTQYRPGVAPFSPLVTLPFIVFNGSGSMWGSSVHSHSELISLYSTTRVCFSHISHLTLISFRIGFPGYFSSNPQNLVHSRQ
jgi:hypothetical protein